MECDTLSYNQSNYLCIQVRGGELSVCYEALAADYPRLASQYRLTPPIKPIRLGWQKDMKSDPHGDSIDSENTAEGTIFSDNPTIV